jgi:hypothetical protein
MERAERRLAEASGASDATRAVIQVMAASESPWPTATTVDATATPSEALCAAIAVVESGS